MVVKPNKADPLYPFRKAVEVAVRASSVDSEVVKDFKAILDERERKHEATLPIVQRVARAGKRLKSATAEFEKRLAAHTALETELADLHTRLAAAHEAMWEASHKVTTLEEEYETLQALLPPPPPPAAEAKPASTTTSAGGGTIEDILFTAMGGISTLIPEDRAGPFVKAFEAMHEMFNQEVRAAPNSVSGIASVTASLPTSPTPPSPRRPRTPWTRTAAGGTRLLERP